MSSPISRRVLIHSVTHYPKTGEDGYRKPTYGTGVVIARVRVEIDKKVVEKSYGKTAEYLGVLFWDAVNSTAATFNKLDKITFGGVDFEIKDIKDLYGDRGTVHHKEIGIA